MGAALTALASTLFIQIGYFLWKVSATHQPRIGSARARAVAIALCTDRRWLTGLACTVVGWLLFVQATAMGDVSLVQPLMSVGDVFLILLAVTFLHERLVPAEWAGIGLTIAGAATLASEPSIAPAAVVSGARLLALVAAAGGLAGLLWLVARRGHSAELTLPLCVGLAFGCGAVLTKSMTAGALQGGAAIVPWQVALDPLLPAIVAANVIGLILLQAAFQRGRASVVVPLQLAAANGVAVAGGMLLFAEHVSPARWLGISMIVAGTAVIHGVGRR